MKKEKVRVRRVTRTLLRTPSHYSTHIIEVSSGRTEYALPEKFWDEDRSNDKDYTLRMFEQVCYVIHKNKLVYSMLHK